MDIVIRPDGDSHCIYSEDIEIRSLGTINIQRASHVEPNLDGTWNADLAPVDGPKLGPFDKRTDALRAETDWLARNWLARSR